MLFQDKAERTYDSDDGFRAIASVQSCGASDNYRIEVENMQANINLIAAAPEKGPTARLSLLDRTG